MDDDARSKTTRVEYRAGELSNSRQGMGVQTEGTGDYQALNPSNKSDWLRHFAIMAVAFSVNHGCVTSVLGLASADFNPSLSAVSSTILYGCYTLSALLLAVPMVKIYGPKRVLVCGTTAYCFYVLPFAVIVLGGDGLDIKARYVMASIGSAIGGIGAGWLWTAQGAYFARASGLYARETGQPIADVNGYFGGVFSTVYVGMEVVCKLFSSVVRDSWKSGGKDLVFVTYAVLCIIAAFAMTFAKRLPKKEDEESSLVVEESQESCFTLMTKKLKDIKIVSRDVKIWLLAPLNIAFGYCASYVAWYINGKVAKYSVGVDNVGYLTAMIPGYAALAGVPYSFLGSHLGKGPMMFLGCLSFFTIGMIGWLVPVQTLIDGGWGTMIGLYLIMGNGRAVFESTNRAVFADFFPDSVSGAFAMFGVQSGLAGMFGFLVFTPLVDIKPVVASTILVAIGAAALLLVPSAFVVNNREKKYRETNEALLSDMNTA